MPRSLSLERFANQSPPPNPGLFAHEIPVLLLVSLLPRFVAQVLGAPQFEVALPIVLPVSLVGCVAALAAPRLAAILVALVD
jgi:hypothetical protein